MAKRKLNDPKDIVVNHHTPRELVATSKCGALPVKIYKNGDPAMTKDYDGNTQWRRGVMEVDLADRLFDEKNKARLTRVLLHEFVHVVEYSNSHEYLSPQTTTENCTELAQAMEDGLGDLYDNLRGLDVIHPSRPLAGKRKRRKARK